MLGVLVLAGLGVARLCTSGGTQPPTTRWTAEKAIPLHASAENRTADDGPADSKVRDIADVSEPRWGGALSSVKAEEGQTIIAQNLAELGLTVSQVNNAAFAAKNYIAEEQVDYTDRRLQPPLKLFLGRSQWLIWNADGTDDAGSVDADYAREFYGRDLGESFSFDIKKAARINELFLHDVVVKVHDYKAIPPTPQAATSNSLNNIIIVELDKQVGRPFPWCFSAKYLLDDPANRTVTLWARKQVGLPTNQTATFFVKIAAKRRGVYTYTVDLLLKRGVRPPETFPLVTVQRSCAFLGGSETTSDVELERQIYLATHPSGPSLPSTPGHGGR